ncbi:hypothetical protein [Streptococcus gallolyticus]|uniref:hypothetical protein n=1 Tax=Streptococcus gallolyticus TaxID=315405 RepID=UPI002283F02C|nr:hypothetical protein [Streptococcus gallolyticus]MCY7186394.1 hypothetical protein [Streptococcus gallolyticus subsp. gallolyticus]MCY7190547.1 hypothetical protein [Streptococcus gallolyticus subsp. gallolyticus]
MKETILVLVFSFFFALSIWQSSVLKERVKNLLQDIEFYKRRVLELDRQMMQLEQNPAIRRGKREDEIQLLKGKLDFLEKEEK